MFGFLGLRVALSGEGVFCCYACGGVGRDEEGGLVQVGVEVREVGHDCGGRRW